MVPLALHAAVRGHPAGGADGKGVLMLTRRGRDACVHLAAHHRLRTIAPFTEQDFIVRSHHKAEIEIALLGKDVCAEVYGVTILRLLK